MVYTMRAVPGLRAQLDEELKVIRIVRDWANQAGVKLSPTALKQITAIVVEATKGNKTMDCNEFAEVERRRRAACSALKKSVKSPKAGSLADRKTDALEKLRSSGLPDDEARVLSELFHQDLEEAVYNSIITWGGGGARSVYTVKTSKTSRFSVSTIKKAKVPTIKPKISTAKDKLKKALKPAGKPPKQHAKNDKQVDQVPILPPKPVAQKHKGENTNINKLAQEDLAKAVQPHKQGLKIAINILDPKEGKKKVPVSLDSNEKKNNAKKNPIAALFKKPADPATKKVTDQKPANDKPKKAAAAPANQPVDKQKKKEKETAKEPTNTKPIEDIKKQKAVGEIKDIVPKLDDKKQKAPEEIKEVIPKLNNTKQDIPQPKKQKQPINIKEIFHKSDVKKQDTTQVNTSNQEAVDDGSGEKKKKKKKKKHSKKGKENVLE